MLRGCQSFLGIGRTPGWLAPRLASRHVPVQSCNGAIGAPSQIPSGARTFALKRVKQRRRSRGRIIQLKQTHYEPKADDERPLPISLLGSGHVRRLLKADTMEAKRLAGGVDWEKYKCDVKGVRWHPMGGWRGQFDRKDHEHNFFVKCSCYFRVQLYGFDRAKELAIAYRQRLEAEWEEQQQIWARMDADREAARLRRREEKERARHASTFGGEEVGDLWGDFGGDAAGVVQALPPPGAMDQGKGV